VKSKILFIAPYSANPKRSETLIPAGLLSIAGFLRKHGYEVKVYNAGFIFTGHVQNIIEDIRKILKDYSPDILGLGFPTDAFESAINIARLAKEIKKETIVIVGGIHPTAMPNDTIKALRFDYLVNGEGEITTLELVNAIITKNKLAAVKGISYKKDGSIITTEPRPEIANLDDIPFDNRDLLVNIEKYPKEALGQIHTSRGCIYNCAYCSSRIIWKDKIRFRSVENVLGEVDYLYSKYKVRNFNFADDNFTSNISHLQSICQGLLKRKYKIRWRCCARGDISLNLNMQDFKLMYNAGCRTICLGFESGAQTILDEVNRNAFVTDTEKTINMVRNAGIEPHADFIVGLPGETEITLSKTLELMKRIWKKERTTMSVAIFKPYPGTPAYERKDLTNYKNLINKFKEIFDFAETCNIKSLSGNLKYTLGRISETLTTPKELLSLCKKAVKAWASRNG